MATSSQNQFPLDLMPCRTFESLQTKQFSTVCFIATKVLNFLVWGAGGGVPYLKFYPLMKQKDDNRAK